jgi:hypothetical protein
MSLAVASIFGVLVRLFGSVYFVAGWGYLEDDHTFERKKKPQNRRWVTRQRDLRSDLIRISKLSNILQVGGGATVSECQELTRYAPNDLTYKSDAIGLWHLSTCHRSCVAFVDEWLSCGFSPSRLSLVTGRSPCARMLLLVRVFFFIKPPYFVHASARILDSQEPVDAEKYRVSNQSRRAVLPVCSIINHHRKYFSW